MPKPENLVRRVRRRLRGRPDRYDEVLERLDRINHWVVHLDARQQDLAHAAQLKNISGQVHDEQARLEDLGGRIDALARRVEAVHHEAVVRDGHRADALRTITLGVASLVEQVAWIDPPVPADGGPLVTVVCPVRDRAALLERALASVRAQTYLRWECVVVDDGSTDVDEAAVARWQADRRVRVVRTPPRGAGAARNRALDESSGEIVAYLDADNVLHPTYLARVVDALGRHAEASWTLTTQLVTAMGTIGVRDDRHPVSTLASGNFADINAVAHRREILDRAGRFDEAFERLGDWDLVQRFAGVAGEPVRIAAVGSTYHGGLADSISRRVPLHPHHRTLRSRGRGRPAEGLRVLLAEWHFPQVSESYVRADAIGLQALGAHVEAWSQDEVAVPYDPGMPFHRGDLAAAIANVRPDVVLTHWLQMGERYRPVVAEAGVPFAVRGHGFDHDHGALDRLLAHPGLVVQAFPHLADVYGRPHPRLRPLPVAFDQDLFPPNPDKDRRLVVRTGAALLTKDYETFFEVASRCPEHRFVVALCTAYMVEDQVKQVLAMRDERDAPVEVLIDLSHAAAAELVASAGIYLHTHGTQHPLGMPISIAESMGTGCYVVARDLPGMSGYLGGAGDLYRDAAHAAALIQQTVHWDDTRWTDEWRTASDLAHTSFGTDDVADTMVRQWREVLGVTPPR